MKIRTGIINIALLATGILGSLLIAEAALRIMDPLKPDRQISYVEKVQRERNSLGLRGKKEYPLENKHFRVLAIGDSFTFGSLLNENGSWPRQMESVLREKYPDIEVLNAGRTGTDTKKQYKLFTETFHKYQPDLVLIAFLLNDCTKLCSNCGPVAYKKRVDRLAKNPSGLETFSYLYRFIKITFLKKELTKKTVEMYKNAYVPDKEPYQQCLKSFTDFKKLSEKSGFKLAVVIYPMLFQLNKNYPFFEEHKLIIDHLNSLNVPVHDLTEAFFGQKDTALWVHPANSHPNRLANSIAAKEAAEFISPMIGK